MDDGMDDGKRPLLRRLLDNPWLLLALGVIIPTVSYTLWGWIEVFDLPIGTLP